VGKRLSEENKSLTLGLGSDLWQVPIASTPRLTYCSDGLSPE